MSDPLPAQTLVDYFRIAAASEKPDLLRSRIEGEWVSTSAAEFARKTMGFAIGLALLGVEREDRVAILSENRPEWPMTDFAALSLGALTVPIDPGDPKAQVEYILKDSLASVVVVSNAAELRKVLEVKGRCPALTHVVLIEHLPWSAGKVTPFDTLVNRGTALISVDPEAFDERAAAVAPSDFATIIYTSDATGEPKGIVLSHENLVSNVAACATLFDLGKETVALSFLPLSHVFERMADYLYFSRAATIAYAESMDNLPEDLVEARPHLFAAVPRVYERIRAHVLASAEKVSARERAVFRWGTGTGRGGLRALEAGRAPGLLARLELWLADRLVFRKIRASLGGRLELAISGGAPLSLDVAEFFWSAGLPVYEVYGLTETGALLTCNRPAEWRLGTVGRPIPGATLKLADDGEILAKGLNVMPGYWRKPEETERAFDADGWLATGDIGTLDVDGYLTLTDRKKETLINANGQNLAPAPIEAALRGLSFVSSAVLIGEGRKFLSALAVPSFERLEGWAAENGVTFRARQDLVRHPKVRSLFQQAIDVLNFDAPPERQIRAFTLLLDDFSVGGGELTPALKLKRRVIDEKYKEVIDRMYAEAESAAETGS